jgi:TRAP-type C4-dicarboxylate transport system permease small subunit
MGFRRFAKTLAGAGEWIAWFGMFVIFAVTLVDVIGAKLFLHPLRASTELVGFVQLTAIGAAMAACFYAGRHIIVEFFVLWLPNRWRQVVIGFATVACLLFFALLAWESFDYGVSLARAGEITSSARIPFYPFAYVLAVFSAITLLFFLDELRNIFRGGSQDDSR